MDSDCEDYVEMKSAVSQEPDVKLTDLQTELTYPSHQEIKGDDTIGNTDQSSGNVQSIYQVPVKSPLTQKTFPSMSKLAVSHF